MARKPTKARRFAALTKLQTEDGVEKAVVKSEQTEDIKVERFTIADSAETTIDRVRLADVRAVKYIVNAQTAGDSSHQTTEVLMATDGTAATLTAYGTLLHANDTLVSFDADVDSDEMFLKADPQGVAGLKFTIEKTEIKKI